jgi:TatD DNase family protein
VFDTHAHLTSTALLPTVDQIVQRAKQAGVHQILNICTDRMSFEEGLKLYKRFPWVRNAAATTPHDVEQEGELNFELFAEAARSKQLAAIGETGLDYHYEHSPKMLQKEFLVRYLHLAKECHLPVIFHCREAFEDLFAIADCAYPKGSPAIVHCFTGTVAEALQAVERGWMISFSGIVTFKKSEALRDAAKVIPLEQLLIETDSPYLAPQSKRGQINEPSFISETLSCLAAVRKVDLFELAHLTTENAERILGKN